MMRRALPSVYRRATQQALPSRLVRSIATENHKEEGVVQLPSPEIAPSPPPSTSSGIWDNTIGLITPVEWASDILCISHTLTGLPWYLSIGVTTLAFRAALLPLHILTLKSQARMQLLQPEMLKLKREFQERGGASNAEARHEFYDKQRSLFKTYKASPFRSLLTPLLQAPIFISFFFGIRNIAQTQYDALSTEGFAWFHNLAEADPTFILPVITGATMLISTEYNMNRNANANAAQGNIMRWMMRTLSVAMVPLTGFMPAAIHVYWIPSNLFTLAQSMAFNIPSVRTALDLPLFDFHKKQAKPSIPAPTVLLDQKPKKKQQK